MDGIDISTHTAAPLEPGVAFELLSGPVAAVGCGPDWTIGWANAAARRLLGSDPVDQPLAAWMDEAAMGSIEGLREPALRQFFKRDGSSIWAIVTLCEWKSGHLLKLVDASELVREREILVYRESIWRLAIMAADHAVWDYNCNNEAQFYSDGWRRLRGFSLEGEVSDNFDAWKERLHPEDRDQVLEHVRRHNEGEVEQFSFEYREQRLDGRWIWILARGRAVEWDRNGKPTRFVGTDIDITGIKLEEARRAEEVETTYRKHLSELKEAHQAAEAARQVAHALARQDPLTGLPNRRVFAEEMEKLAAGPSPFAVLLIDLDRFKPINDVHGHAAGDYVIRESARRLLRALASEGMVARLGGDEFGVIVCGASAGMEAAAELCAQKLIAELSAPIPLGGYNLAIGASVGIAIQPQHGRDSNALFRNADMALYASKQASRGAWTFYSPAMGREAESKAALELEVRRAVAEDSIEPYFQPIVDMQTGCIATMEILARWNHPLYGAIAPDRFIPIIDQFGLSSQFTLSMLRRSCMAAAGFPREVSISINLTAKEVCDPVMPVQILKVLMECRFLASRLEIEVTEQALVHDLAAAKSVIAALRSAGVRVLLDDFGTGYSGLGYLRELKFDCIKIDRSFVATLAKQPESGKIINAMQTLAQNLGLATVAEGIEDAETWDAIRSLGCTYGQGYHFSKAVSAADAAAMLAGESQRARKAG